MREVRLSPSGAFDNRPFESAHFNVRPLASALGAEIAGVRLADLDGAALADFRAALWRHKMLFVRGQDLSHAQHHAFAARLGPFATDAYTQGVAGYREVQPVIKEADTVSKAMFGSGWHTDSPFLAEPPSVTMLRAVEVPPWGGDTVWANTALAWRMLSPAMQAVLRPLRVVMSARDNAYTQERVSGRELAFASDDSRRAALAGTAHPLVRRHPESGEEALYVDEVYAVGIDGMSEEEARPILDFLVRHVTQHGFTCRLRWEPGTVALWDNRTTIHLAANDYDGWRREMYRATIAGERPTA